MSARPAAARAASPRAGTAPRSSSRPAGRTSAAPRSTPGPAGSSSPSRGGSSGGGRVSGNEPRDPGEPRQITLRTAGIALVLLVAFIVLAPTFRAYVSQQEQLRDVNSSLAEANTRAEALQDELLRWDDPEYVKSQASSRFGWVEPGQTAYKVVDPETVTGEDPIADLAAQNAERSPYAPAGTSVPWYSTIWGSVEVAGAAQGAGAADEATGVDGVQTEPEGADPADGDAPPSTETPPSSEDPAATE